MYLDSFWELDSERASGGGTLGRIPRSKVMAYGREEYGFDPDTLSIFWQIISTMDGGFLGWQKNEHDRYVRQHSKKGKGGRRTSRQTYNR